MSEPRAPWLLRLDKHVARAEAWGLFAVVVVLVALSLLQFVAHKVFSSGFDWADIVVRQMVLWIGFLGGALATRKGRHISIDAIKKFVRPPWGDWLSFFTSTAALVIVTIMTFASVTFVQDELANQSTLFKGCPSWPFKVVMPLALSAVGFHFAVQAYLDLLGALGRRPLIRRDSLDDESNRDSKGAT